MDFSVITVDSNVFSAAASATITSDTAADMDGLDLCTVSDFIRVAQNDSGRFGKELGLSASKAAAGANETVPVVVMHEVLSF